MIAREAVSRLVPTTRSYMRLLPTRARTGAPRSEPFALFAFDLASVETYLVADRVLKCAPDTIEWYAVPSLALLGTEQLGGLDADRQAAERRAEDLGLPPLQWPKHHPDPVPRAMRAAAYAARIGSGGQFMHVCARLAFAAGLDLDTPTGEPMQSAATAAHIDPTALLDAADDRRDDEDRLLDREKLAANGVARLPALRLAGSVACGDRAIARLLLAHGKAA